MGPDEIDEVLGELELVKRKVRGDGEALAAIERVEARLADVESMALAYVRRASRDPECTSRIVDRMRRNGELRRFCEYVKRPWAANKLVAAAVQLLWTAVAAVAFVLGVYFFLPTHAFFGGPVNSTTIVRGVLELILKNPGILRVVDPLFKILGVAMMAVAAVSLYQAHAAASRGGGR